MATYNGRRYVTEQLETILSEIGPEDEVIVVDDASTDDTIEIITSIGDSRIRVHANPQNLGYVRNFEKALSLAKGEYVFLSDQDDLWLRGRLDLMISALQKTSVVASNFRYIGDAPRRVESLRLRTSDEKKNLTNLFMLWVGLRPYYGCAMAMRREALGMILPFPRFLTETHDQWIALCANVTKSISHLSDDTLIRRLHESNTTPKTNRPLWVILRARWMLLRAFVVALSRKPRLRH